MKLVNWKSMLTLLIALTLFLAACGSDDDTNGDTDTENDDVAVEEANNDGAEEEEEVEEEAADEWEYQPEAINPDVDVCEVCAMAVGDDQFATQIVLQDERSLKFDDIGCMYNWLDENGEDEVGEKFVRDYNTEEWILMEEATYVFDEGIQTPMAYGVISFENEADADSFIEEHGAGEILTYNQIIEDHVWQMMKHGHGDDHNHDMDDMDDHDMEMDDEEHDEM